MKTILFVSLIFFAIAMSVHAELTPQDLDKIRLIIKEEIKGEIAPLKADNETLKISVARLEGRLTGDVAQLEGRLTGAIARVDGRVTGIEGRLNGIEKQISHSTNVTYGLIALIVVAIGIPAWRGKRDRDQERKIEALTHKIEVLTREIEALKQQPIVSP